MSYGRSKILNQVMSYSTPSNTVKVQENKIQRKAPLHVPAATASNKQGGRNVWCELYIYIYNKLVGNGYGGYKSIQNLLIVN